MRVHKRIHVILLPLYLSYIFAMGCSFLDKRPKESQGDIYEIKVQIGRLQTLQGDTHKLLNSYISEEQQRNQAALSAFSLKQNELEKQIIELRDEIRQLKNRIEELRFSVGKRDSFPRDDSTEATLANEPSKNFKQISEPMAIVEGEPIDGATLLNSARDYLIKGRYENARAALLKYLEHFGESKEAEQAFFLLGDSYFYEKNYAEALKQYTHLAEVFKNGASAPDALLKSALCLMQLKRGAEAKATLNKIIEQFPQYNDMPKAKDMLKEIHE
ncbi:MAG: tol-pal system protein YbgF [candidate division BRC1 bacterium ADurb.Bin183]|nr:MAG: tol-pal system protein YbgF [candidate division BRC1 bacterium ADurb.Bin183]